MADPLHILVVDDEVEAILFLTEFLLSRKHRVETAMNGEDALKAIMRRGAAGDPYDLIISDLSMPGLDGVRLLTELRRRGDNTLFALFTAYADVQPHLADEARHHGCCAVLAKPVDLLRVDQLLAEVARRRTSQVATRPRDDQPFFGTSKTVRRSDTPPQGERLSSPGEALERRRTPLPVAPVARPATRTPAPVAPPARRPSRSDLPAPPLTTKFRTPIAVPAALALQPAVVDPVASPTRPLTTSLRAPIAQPAVTSALSAPPPPAPAAATNRQTHSNPADAGTAAPTARSTQFLMRPPTVRYQRTASGLCPPGGSIDTAPVAPSANTTARLRRSVTGTLHRPTRATTEPAPEPGTGGSRLVPCASCHVSFAVAIKPTDYNTVCIHCGQLNRITAARRFPCPPAE